MATGTLNSITSPGTITVVTDGSGQLNPGDIITFNVSLYPNPYIGDLVSFDIDNTGRDPVAINITLITSNAPVDNNSNTTVNMTTQNLNIVLTNALCCISAQAAKVSKLYSIGNKCVESEVQKLKLMNDWFEALRCYNANDYISTKFALRLNYTTYLTSLDSISNSGRNYILTVNGIAYTIQGDGVTKISALLNTLAGTISDIIDFKIIVEPDSYSPRYAYAYIEALCDVTSINYQVIKISDDSVITNIDYTLYQQGYCTITNCLSKEQFDSILSKLMNACDICECQLKQ